MKSAHVAGREEELDEHVEQVGRVATDFLPVDGPLVAAGVQSVSIHEKSRVRGTYTMHAMR